MRKKAKIELLTLILCVGISFTAHSQVTIGTQTPPLKGALLELKQSDDTSGSENSNGGLILPRVSLNAINTLAPMLTGSDLSDASLKPSYTGLMVYNVNEASSFEKGLYIWDGTQWNRINTSLIDSIAAKNGLYFSTAGDTIKLGGNLTENTAINQSTYNLQFSGDGKLKVGGTTAPTAASARFEVDGASANTTAYNAQNGTAIDFSKSNLAYTSASAGAFTLNNIKDGGTYTLAVQGTTSGTASFSAAGITTRILNSSPTSGQTLYTIIVMGTTAYIYESTGF